MAVVSVTEINSGRDGTLGLVGVRKYKRAFRVEVNDPHDSVLTVTSAPGIPRRYDRYVEQGVYDLLALALEAKATPEDAENPYFWLVTVDYDTNLWEQLRRKAASSGQGDSSNPSDATQDPTEITFDWVQFTRPAARDSAGNPVVNKANEWFDPPIEIDDSRPRIVITRNEPFFDTTLPGQYRNTVNQEPFLGYDAGTVMCAGITARTQFQNGSYFWKVTYEFHVDVRGWGVYVLNQGYHELGPDGKPKVILDGNGTPVSKPVMLDNAGHQLAAGAQPVWLQFNFHPLKSFLPLRLP